MLLCFSLLFSTAAAATTVQILSTPAPTSVCGQCCQVAMVLMDEDENRLNELATGLEEKFSSLVLSDVRLRFNLIRWQLPELGDAANLNPLKFTSEKVCESVANCTTSVILIHSENQKKIPAAVAYALGFFRIPVISISARDSDFVEKSFYPTLVRMVPARVQEAEVWAKILAALDFKKVILFSANDHESDLLLTAFAKKADELKIERDTVLFSSGATDFTSAFEQIRQLTSNVVVLQASTQDTEVMFTQAQKWNLTGSGYAWILSGISALAKNAPYGSISVGLNSNVDVSSSQLRNQNDGFLLERIDDAIQALVTAYRSSLFATAAENDSSKSTRNFLERFQMIPPRSCKEKGNYYWSQGADLLLKKLKEVYVPKSKQQSNLLAFDESGGRVGLPYAVWNHLGSSVDNDDNVSLGQLSLDKDSLGRFPVDKVSVGRCDYVDRQLNCSLTGEIRWPGNATKPSGRRQKMHLRILTVEEVPFVFAYRVQRKQDCETLTSTDGTSWVYCTKPISTDFVESYCCKGLCVEMMLNLTNRMGVHSFDLILSKDRVYGARRLEEDTDGQLQYRWSGVMGELVDEKVDMAIAALTINPQRDAAVDFSKPFLYHGITILEKRKQRLSPMETFMQPFEWPLWVSIFSSVFVIAVSLYTLDKLSPFSKYLSPTIGVVSSMGEMKPVKKSEEDDDPLTLSGAMWFAWGVLLDSGIGEKTPRSLSARVLGMVWCGFTMIIMASYTANLAAFLVLDRPDRALTGITDQRLRNPTGNFTYATVQDTNVYMYFKEKIELSTMFRTMEGRNYKTGEAAVEALKNGSLDAFIWDSLRLEYEANRDCALVTSGELFGRSAYGVAMPKHSPWTAEVTLQILQMHEDGYMEQLDSQWLRKNQSECKAQADKNTAAQLGLTNMRDVFILVAGGIALSALLICIEIVVIRKHSRATRRLQLMQHYGKHWLEVTRRRKFLAACRGQLEDKSPRTVEEAWNKWTEETDNDMKKKEKQKTKIKNQPINELSSTDMNDNRKRFSPRQHQQQRNLAGKAPVLLFKNGSGEGTPTRKTKVAAKENCASNSNENGTKNGFDEYNTYCPRTKALLRNASDLQSPLINGTGVVKASTSMGSAYYHSPKKGASAPHTSDTTSTNSSAPSKACYSGTSCVVALKPSPLKKKSNVPRENYIGVDDWNAAYIYRNESDPEDTVIIHLAK